MATLTVTVSKDYRFAPANAQVDGQNIALIHFATAGAVSASFSSSQFGGTSISNFVTIEGSANLDQFVVVMSAAGTFDARDWSFSSWSVQDQVSIIGTASNDIIFGASAGTIFRGMGGRDTMIGGAGSDYFFYADGEVAVDEIADGGGGNDTIRALSGNVNLSLIDLVSVENADIGIGATLELAANQAGAGAISLVSGATGSGTIEQLRVTGSKIDMSGVTFSQWFNGEDIINLEATGAAADILGSSRNDLIAGTPGQDSLFGGAGDDTIAGGDSDDILSGGAGNDQIYAGNGIDRIEFSGARQNYFINTYNNGAGLIVTQISDRTAVDGTDLVVDAETLRFSATDFSLRGAQLDRVSNITGGRYDSIIFHNDATGQTYVNVSTAGSITGSYAYSSANGAQWDAVDTADFSNDGIADVILRNAADGSLAIGVSASGMVSGYTYITQSLSTSYRLAGVGDVDGDAWNDLIIQNSSNGVVYVGDMSGTTFNQWTAVSAEGTGWQVRAIGDVNGDGRSDIIYQNTGTGFISAGLMSASGTISGYQTITMGDTLNWTVKEAGDINRDGYADIIIQNNGNGDISYVNMANGTASSYGSVLTGFGTAWQLEALGDVNNDGDMDAVIRNTLGSGDTYIINMESGGFSGFTLVAQGIGSDWYVV